VRGKGDARNRCLADALGVAVMSVDSRLVPEHPLPAAPDDCETAALWLLKEAETVFGTTRLAIGGASAGATLAMTTVLRLRDRGMAEPFVGAALQFGTYDLSGQSSAGRLLAEEHFIRRTSARLPTGPTPTSPPCTETSEAYRRRCSSSGAWTSCEDNLAMAARLPAAGGAVDIRVYPESRHGFTSFDTAMASAALRDIDSWLGDRFLDT
jgi:acetyl esterase